MRAGDVAGGGAVGAAIVPSRAQVSTRTRVEIAVCAGYGVGGGAGGVAIVTSRA